MTESKQRLDWVNVSFISFVHLVAAFTVVYLIFIQFSWWTIGLGLIWLACCGISITGGYHRLFSHPTYKATKLLKAFYLFFGAAAVQNSALKWSADHRVHHTFADREEDPYNIKRGFWWAHIGWVFFKDKRHDEVDFRGVPDLAADGLVRFQDRFYIPVALVSGVVLPFSLGLLWGDPIGAVLVAGFLRLVVLWHATFSVNSFAHMVGYRPYCLKNSARDSFFTALITMGEGYHNFHHRFMSDYRNGVRWYHFDPTKWFVWTLSKIGVTSDLKRVPKRAIDRAREEVALAQKRAQGERGQVSSA